MSRGGLEYYRSSINLNYTVLSQSLSTPLFCLILAYFSSSSWGGGGFETVSSTQGLLFTSARGKAPPVFFDIFDVFFDVVIA